MQNALALTLTVMRVNSPVLSIPILPAIRHHTAEMPVAALPLGESRVNVARVKRWALLSWPESLVCCPLVFTLRVDHERVSKLAALVVLLPIKLIRF